MTKYIIALDQGTTSSRTIIYDKNATPVVSAQKEFEQIYPQPGWVEHDPEEIWQSQLYTLKESLKKGKILLDEIETIGITNQRETTILWDKNTDEVVYNAIVWQCRRTTQECQKLKDKYDNLIYEKTGLPIDSYFSASKIKWILDNVPGVKERAKKGDILFGTIDTYLMWKLSGGKIHATDYTNASRTLLFNIHDLCWDKQLLEIFDIPQSMLPQVYPSSHLYGYTDEKIVGKKIKIGAVAGDQHSALFGHLCVHKGDCKNTYGTGCFVMMNTGDKAVVSRRGLITTLAASTENGRPQYILEGSVFMGGAVLQWLRDELRIIDSARQADVIAEQYPDTNGVYIVPAFVGLGAPYWDSNARGTITGMTRGTSREHIVTASLNSIAYQVFDVVHAMEGDLNQKVGRFFVDGGACVSNVLMQFQADLLQSKVWRPTIIETTARGVCFLAGLQSGIWKDIEDIKINCDMDRVFEPQMQDDERERLLMGWVKAVARAKYI